MKIKQRTYHRFKRQLNRLARYADRPWYPILVACLAGADAYIFIVPIEVLLIPNVLYRPKRWWRTALWVSLGSALGATSFAVLAGLFGQSFVKTFLPQLLQSKAWMHSVLFLNRHGAVGLALISLSPFPQHPAVAFAGLARLPVATIFGAIFLGRAVKYLVLAAVTAYSPKLLRKWW